MGGITRTMQISRPWRDLGGMIAKQTDARSLEPVVGSIDLSGFQCPLRPRITNGLVHRAAAHTWPLKVIRRLPSWRRAPRATMTAAAAAAAAQSQRPRTFEYRKGIHTEDSECRSPGPPSPISEASKLESLFGTRRACGFQRLALVYVNTSLVLARSVLRIRSPHSGPRRGDVSSRSLQVCTR